MFQSLPIALALKASNTSENLQNENWRKSYILRIE